MSAIVFIIIAIMPMFISSIIVIISILSKELWYVQLL